MLIALFFETGCVRGGVSCPEKVGWRGGRGEAHSTRERVNVFPIDHGQEHVERDDEGNAESRDSHLTTMGRRRPPKRSTHLSCAVAVAREASAETVTAGLELECQLYRDKHAQVGLG